MVERRQFVFRVPTVAEAQRRLQHVERFLEA